MCVIVTRAWCFLVGGIDAQTCIHFLFTYVVIMKIMREDAEEGLPSQVKPHSVRHNIIQKALRSVSKQHKNFEFCKN